jgi:hypothetical protein
LCKERRPTSIAAGLAEKGRNKKVPEANKEEKPYDPFTYYMNLWYDYVNACNSMYAEYIRYVTKMNESWLNSFSKFWSGPYKDKVKVE